MAEIARPIETTPDFGFPTEEELQRRANFWTYGIGNVEYDESGKIIYPDGIVDIDERFDLARQKKFAYERGPTSVIPERMLKPETPVAVTALYDMTNIYYWWNTDTTELTLDIHPESMIPSILIDLNAEQFNQIVSALHSEFSSYCKFASKNGVCNANDGNECLARKLDMMKKWNGSSPLALRNPHIRAKHAVELIKKAFWDDGSGYSPFRQKLDLHNSDRLASAGLDDLQALDSRNVLDHEIGRRAMSVPYSFPADISSHQGYASFRAEGGSFEGFLDFVADSNARDPVRFGFVVDEFEDIPSDADTWPLETKLALARRAVLAESDWYRLIETSVLWKEDGIIPEYLYRFRTVFTDEPI